MIYTGVETERRNVRMKQDVYEHLAKTFLDKKKKKKPDRNILIFAAVSVVVFILVLSTATFFLTKKKFFTRSLYVLNNNSPTVIEYDFTSLGLSKTRAMSFNLNNIDLSKYHFLALTIRTKENTRVGSTIKAQIENTLLEKDAQYITGINQKWKRVSLPLSNFKLIKDWSNVKTLVFMVEDWNVYNKKDSIIIDDIRFVE